jgi:F-type H+-transporting ATPase subunit gamma
MAKARSIVKRRKAVRNIRKITQTMQLIATARFQKCLGRATAGKPYTEKLTEMIETLADVGSLDHPLLRPSTSAARHVLLVITSNRGLCGSYNAAVLRTAADRFREIRSAGGQVEMVGKKGVNYFRFMGYPVERTVTDVDDRIAYARVAEMADRYIAAFLAGEVSRVDVAYMRFLSVGAQRPAVSQLLPIEAPPREKTTGARREFEFSPPPEELLDRLIPETVKVRLYQYFNDAIVSEQVARMVAMKAATDASGDMIKSLTREYNRARQSQITLELADIVGGAEAVGA